MGVTPIEMEDSMFLTEDNTQQSQISQAAFRDMLREKLRGAVRITLITVLEEGMEAYGLLFHQGALSLA
jgi:hypothetical protein